MRTVAGPVEVAGATTRDRAVARSALIVRVDPAQAVVAALRARYDPAARLGVPAHITVLFPFMPPRQIDAAVRRRIQAAVRSVPVFAYTLAQTGRFPDTLYLVPEPSAPFIALTRALADEFVQYPPFGAAHDSIVPHLTVVHGDADAAALVQPELAGALERHGPISAICREVELIQNSTGRWEWMRSFALAA